MTRRNPLFLALAITTLLAACGDEPTTPEARPADGSVGVWGSCRWDGSNIYELCEPSLVCTDYGFCVPPCETVEDCHEFEYGDRCESMSNPTATDVCTIACDAETPCPELDGLDLKCDLGLEWCYQ